MAKRRIRGAVGRTFMGVPVLRRWYVRRMLKYIDKSREKGRRLPEGMAETARFLSRVPKQKRAEAFEEAILAQRNMPEMSREMRRAASRQRKSGQSEVRYRPGSAPNRGKQSRPRPR